MGGRGEGGRIPLLRHSVPGYRFFPVRLNLQVLCADFAYTPTPENQKIAEKSCILELVLIGFGGGLRVGL